jgi:hypothetical protein
MIAELPNWSSQDFNYNDHVIMCLGLSLNLNISDAFSEFPRVCNIADYSTYMKLLKTRDFNVMDLPVPYVRFGYSYALDLQPIVIYNRFDDEYQQLFYEVTIRHANATIQVITLENRSHSPDPRGARYTIHNLINYITNNLFGDRTIKQPTIEQFYEHYRGTNLLAEINAAFPTTYNPEFKPMLDIYKSVPHSMRLHDLRISKPQLATLAELSGYNLLEYPITMINCMIRDITDPDELRNFYAKITNQYVTGKRTKPALRELSN